MPEEHKLSKPELKDIDQALAEVVAWAKDNPSLYAQAALAYVSGLDMAKEMRAGEGECIQLLYIQSNLQYWKGDVARQAKAVIKARIKELS